MLTQSRTTRRLVLLASVSTGLALAGCASAPTARASFEPSTNFAQYKTYAFADPLGTDRVGYSSIVSQHLMAATQLELAARGMTRVDTSPQLLVNFSANLSEKLQVSTLPSSTVVVRGRGYYGYRGGMYTTWPGYEQTTVTQYTQGTLNIDIVDAARKQLVWEGVVTDSVTQKDLDDIQTAIKAAVTAAFAKYPIAATAK